MEYIAQAMRMMIWLGVVGFLFRRYDEPVRDLLAAARIYFENAHRLAASRPEVFAPAPLAPEPPLTPIAIAEVEVLKPVADAPPSKPVHAKYSQAQDLALRAIQAEYGVSVGRQLSGGADMGFDGVFSHEGKLNIVEVKFVSALFNDKSMKQAVERITSTIIRQGWLNVRIVLVVVSENGEGFGAKIAALRKHFLANPVPVVVTVYTLSDLRARNAVMAAE